MGERRGEDEVGTEHPGVPADRVEDDRMQHQRVQGQRPGVIRDQQCASGAGQVLHPTQLQPEPLLGQQPRHRQDDAFGELGVEAELVDHVVSCQARLRVRHQFLERPLPFNAQFPPERDQGGSRISGELAKLITVAVLQPVDQRSPRLMKSSRAASVSGPSVLSGSSVMA